MIAKILGALVIILIIYYVGRIFYKKLDPNSDCGSCSTCDQSCPFAGGNYDLNYDAKEEEKKDENTNDITK